MSNKLVISHSQMSMFEECPRKWHLRYVQKRKQFIGPALHFGRIVHSMIETRLNPADTKVYTETDFEYAKDKAETAYTSAQKLVKSAINGLKNWDVIGFPGITKINTSAIEYKFELSKFRGIIDLWYGSSNNETIVIDWKTTSKKYTKHDIKTAPQLTAYAWAMYKIHGKIPNLLCFITLDKNTHEASLYAGTRNKDDIKLYEERVETNYAEMKRKVNYKKESGCITQWGKCDFYSECWGTEEPIIIENGNPPNLEFEGLNKQINSDKIDVQTSQQCPLKENESPWF